MDEYADCLSYFSVFLHHYSLHRKVKSTFHAPQEYIIIPKCSLKNVH